MVCSVVGDEAVASGAALNEQANVEEEVGIGAGSETFNIVFENICAGHVGDGDGRDEEEDPPAAAASKVEQHECAEKNV